MKKIIKVLCNPKDNPVKRPCNIRVLYTEEGSNMGEIRIARALKTWGEKNGLVVIRHEINEYRGEADGEILTEDSK